ncbi:MAG: alpha/beta hydrolase-fold protein [Pirellulales bacterium]
MSYNTLERVAAFMQFQADDVIRSEEKIALMVSGWLANSDYAVRNLPTALSMYDTRSLMTKYFAEPTLNGRNKIVEELKRQEAFIPDLIARIIALMKPPLDLPAQSEKVAGMYEIQIDYLPEQTPIGYTVQLPQEYDPHRRYPVIMALHGAGATPTFELEWWAGGATADGRRFGQADRFGYIVIAPAWAKEQQTAYNYSEDEHAAVLYTLRDAYRRFSIDTDRVFVAGHGMGGDAAWEMSISHPDLWAGFIGISAQADKTINYYKENARYMAKYLVCGELDNVLWGENAVQLDEYLSRGDNMTAVQYKGRGREHFSDELLRLFDWMSRQKRDPFPREYKCRSVRYFDGFFWWVDTANPPERGMIDPDNLPPKGYVPLYVKRKAHCEQRRQHRHRLPERHRLAHAGTDRL